MVMVPGCAHNLFLRSPGEFWQGYELISSDGQGGYEDLNPSSRGIHTVDASPALARARAPFANRLELWGHP